MALRSSPFSVFLSYRTLYLGIKYKLRAARRVAPMGPTESESRRYVIRSEHRKSRKWEIRLTASGPDSGPLPGLLSDAKIPPASSIPTSIFNHTASSRFFSSDYHMQLHWLGATLGPISRCVQFKPSLPLMNSLSNVFMES